MSPAITLQLARAVEAAFNAVAPVLTKLGMWALTGSSTAELASIAGSMLKAAFGEELPAAAEQLKIGRDDALAGLLGGMLGGVGGVTAAKLAGELTELGTAIPQVS